MVTVARSNGVPTGHVEDLPIFSEPDAIDASCDGANMPVAVRPEPLLVSRSED